MKRTTLAAAVAVLALVTAGCSGGDDGATAPATEGTGQQASTPADDESTPADDTSTSAAPTDGDGTVLTAMVGTSDDPDAYEITLMDSSGEEVTDLPAGDYTIEVDDPTAIHNFHLLGGDVDESTSVSGVETVTWQVTLAPGDYTYKCDPHPPMTKTFTVS